MNADLFLWLLGRVCGLSSFAAVSLAVVSGVSLRSGTFRGLATNRALNSVHQFTTVLWLPLGILHVLALTLDQTARLTIWDVFIPFIANYDGRGRLAIGLGTVSLDLILVVALTGWLRRRLSPALWRWLHRLSYPAFALFFVHAVLSGTDFSSPVVSAITWSSAFALAVLSAGRVIWGRLPAH
ncbi:MAG: ferric reductase-like transmembrane domain-containing protein [Candidatus Dormibacteraeota bacterium]|nr:ferric reductase-like transmembrane domain-containing protein [Candidatus Dormibacteraeota bacterium]